LPIKALFRKTWGYLPLRSFSRDLLSGVTEVSAQALKSLSLKALSAYPLRRAAPRVGGGNSARVIPA
jgi:hypothetical protein